MDEEKQILFIDTGLVFLSNLALQGTVLILRLLIGHYWGAEDLGLYSLAISINYILLLLCSFGIPQAAVKFISEKRSDIHRQKELVTTTLSVAVLSGIVMGILLYPLSVLTGEIWKMKDLPELVSIFLMGLPFSLTFQAVLSVLNGLRELKYYSFFNTLNAILILSLTFIAAVLHLPIQYTVWSFVVATVVSTLLGFWPLRHHLTFQSLRSLTSVTSELFRFGIKLMAANSVQIVNTRADLLLVGYFLGKAPTGYYSIATVLARMLLLIPGAVQVITYPMTSELFGAGKKDRASRFMERSAFYSFILLSFLGILIIFYCDDFLRSYNPKYLPAVMPLRILTLFFIFYGTTVSIGGAFASYGRPDIALKLAMISMILNFSFNVLFIPRWGIGGAALATGLALGVFVPSYPFLLRKIIRIRIKLHDFGIASLLFLLLAGVLYLLGKIINPLLAGGIVFLGGVTIILKFLIKEELKDYPIVHQTRLQLRQFINSLKCSGRIP
ncbi:MAG: flippase [candidate division KSB1 bacterium]|nr:flippase [candidate division KSB1 bacterium]